MLREDSLRIQVNCMNSQNEYYLAKLFLFTFYIQAKEKGIPALMSTPNFSLVGLTSPGFPYTHRRHPKSLSTFTNLSKSPSSGKSLRKGSGKQLESELQTQLPCPADKSCSFYGKIKDVKIFVNKNVFVQASDRAV